MTYVCQVYLKMIAKRYFRGSFGEKKIKSKVLLQKYEAIRFFILDVESNACRF